jgi:hypothetical protein
MLLLRGGGDEEGVRHAFGEHAHVGAHRMTTTYESQEGAAAQVLGGEE